MYAGRHKSTSTAAGRCPRFQPLGVDAVAHHAARGVNAAASGPEGFLLYMTAVNDNGYQMYAAGLDEYHSGMAQMFLTRFPNVPNCTSTVAELRAEPKSGGALCHLGTSLLPYSDGKDPMLQSYSHVYVPTSRLAEVVSGRWTLTSRPRCTMMLTYA